MCESEEKTLLQGDAAAGCERELREATRKQVQAKYGVEPEGQTGETAASLADGTTTAPTDLASIITSQRAARVVDEGEGSEASMDTKFMNLSSSRKNAPPNVLK